jgi:hypothetical protein
MTAQPARRHELGRKTLPTDDPENGLAAMSFGLCFLLDE